MIFPLSTNSPSPTPTASPSPEAGEASWHWLTDLTHYLDPTHLWGAVGLGIVFIAIGMILSWIVRRTLKTVIDHDPNERIDRMTVSFIQHLGTFIMWIVLALIFSHVVPSLNKVTTSLLAGVSIVRSSSGLLRNRRWATSCPESVSLSTSPSDVATACS